MPRNNPGISNVQSIDELNAAITEWNTQDSLFKLNMRNSLKLAAQLNKSMEALPQYTSLFNNNINTNNANVTKNEKFKAALVTKNENFTVALNSYIGSRRKSIPLNFQLDNTHHHYKWDIFGRLFGYSHQVKISAANKLIDHIKGNAKNTFTTQELRALCDGNLGKIVSRYEALKIKLPKQLTEHKYHRGVIDRITHGISVFGFKR